MPRPFLALAAALALAFVACGGGSDTLVLGATTSLQDTGLLDELVRAYEQQSGYDVKSVVGGSGQILEMARRGEIDVVITHSPEEEERFVKDGDGVDRRPVMENYFLLAGPPDDPAGVTNVTTLSEAFRLIANARLTFISRGDNSGTNVRELSVWREAGIDPHGQSWYQESAAGQGQNLLLASEKGAYTLVDSSTFTVFAQRVRLAAFAIDHQNPNVYSVTRVNAQKHSSVNGQAAIAFADFVTSIDGRCLIANFGREKYGESLFSAACPRSNTG